MYCIKIVPFKLNIMDNKMRHEWKINGAMFKYLFFMMVIMCDEVGFHYMRNKHITAIIVFLYIKLPKNDVHFIFVFVGIMYFLSCHYDSPVS